MVGRPKEGFCEKDGGDRMGYLKYRSRKGVDIRLTADTFIHIRGKEWFCCTWRIRKDY
jgi:hypothetical protein